MIVRVHWKRKTPFKGTPRSRENKAKTIPNPVRFLPPMPRHTHIYYHIIPSQELYGPRKLQNGRCPFFTHELYSCSSLLFGLFRKLSGNQRLKEHVASSIQPTPHTAEDSAPQGKRWAESLWQWHGRLRFCLFWRRELSFSCELLVQEHQTMPMLCNMKAPTLWLISSSIYCWSNWRVFGVIMGCPKGMHSLIDDTT